MTKLITMLTLTASLAIGATYTDIIPVDSPDSVELVEVVTYKANTPRDNGALLHSRNEAISMPKVATGTSTITNELGEAQTVTNYTDATCIVYDDGLRNATEAEVEAIQVYVQTKELERIAGIATTYGADLVLLDMLMQKIGLNYPTDPEAVEAHILSLVEAGNDSALLIGLAIDRQWEALASVEDDLLAIWEMINTNGE